MSSTAYVRTKSLKLKLLPAGEEGTKDQVTEFSFPQFSEHSVYQLESGIQNFEDLR